MLSCRPGPGPCGRAREARDDRDVGGASLHFSDFTHVHCARPGSAGEIPIPASAIARTPRFVRFYTGRCISFLMYKDMHLSNCVLALRSALLSEISQSSRREERIPQTITKIENQCGDVFCRAHHARLRTVPVDDAPACIRRGRADNGASRHLSSPAPADRHRR
jgi:hypothetical protein